MPRMGLGRLVGRGRRGVGLGARRAGRSVGAHTVGRRVVPHGVPVTPLPTPHNRAARGQLRRQLRGRPTGLPARRPMNGAVTRGAFAGRGTGIPAGAVLGGPRMTPSGRRALTGSSTVGDRVRPHASGGTRTALPAGERAALRAQLSGRGTGLPMASSIPRAAPFVREPAGPGRMRRAAGWARKNPLLIGGTAGLIGYRAGSQSYGPGVTTTNTTGVYGT